MLNTHWSSSKDRNIRLTLHLGLLPELHIIVLCSDAIQKPVYSVKYSDSIWEQLNTRLFKFGIQMFPVFGCPVFISPLYLTVLSVYIHIAQSLELFFNHSCFCSGNRSNGAISRHGWVGSCHRDANPGKKFRGSGMCPILQRPVQQDDESSQVCQNEAKLLRS